MKSTRVDRLPGMRDATGATYQRLRNTQDALSAFAGRRGYEFLDTPVLEETELFVRKSGGELTSRLYTFVGPGGHRVSLRPEFTSSVIRHFIQERQGLTTPVRWRYAGPVFRHEQEDGGTRRQFTQVGAELIGAGGIEADVEVLVLAWEGLREAGLGKYRLRIGHLGVLHDLLSSYGLSEPAKLFIIGSVQDLNGGRTDMAALTSQAGEIGLLGDGPAPAEGHSLAAGAEAARELIQGIVGDSVSGQIGRRTSEEIAGRLLRKVRAGDRPEKLQAALEMVAELALLVGPPESVLERARDLVATRGLSAAPFQPLAALFDALAAAGVDGSRTVLDLGLARGLSYYTGVIFDLAAPASEGPASLGGGGRYDGLVKALGGDDAPAMGFAYTLELVVEALELEGSVAAGADATT